MQVIATSSRAALWPLPRNEVVRESVSREQCEAVQASALIVPIQKWSSPC